MPKDTAQEADSPQQPQGEIDSLLRVIRSSELRSKDPSRVAAAINRLGELHATEAVDDLIPLLAFKYPRDDDRIAMQPMHFGFGYPAMFALSRIGRPALPALVKAIADYPHEALESRHALISIAGIFREDLPAGISYLERASKEARVPSAAEKLKAAAKHLRNIHEKRRP